MRKVWARSIRPCPRFSRRRPSLRCRPWSLSSNSLRSCSLARRKPKLLHRIGEEAVCILHATRGPPGRGAEALDQSLGPVQHGEAFLYVLQAGEIGFGRVGPKRALGFLQLSR